MKAQHALQVCATFQLINVSTGRRAWHFCVWILHQRKEWLPGKILIIWQSEQTLHNKLSELCHAMPTIFYMNVSPGSHIKQTLMFDCQFCSPNAGIKWSWSAEHGMWNLLIPYFPHSSMSFFQAQFLCEHQNLALFYPRPDVATFCSETGCVPLNLSSCQTFGTIH